MAYNVENTEELVLVCTAQEQRRGTPHQSWQQENQQQHQQQQ